MARYYKGKRIAANVYTQGKFGKRLRETLDTESSLLYSDGRNPTKLTAADLPEDYIKIHSRVIWYMRGYLRTAGIVDMRYRWVRENHLFKDDYIYISYHGPIKEVTNHWGFKDYEEYDICVCGNDIVDILICACFCNKIEQKNASDCKPLSRAATLRVVDLQDEKQNAGDKEGITEVLYAYDYLWRC